MDRLPPLRLLTAFDEVARHGSMNAAALRLNITQPAVSQALKALEAHLGAQLFDRSTRPAQLTAAGRRLASATGEGLGVISTAIAEIQRDARADEAQVTVACTLGMATYWLMPRLPDFYAAHSRMIVNVQAPPTDTPMLEPGVDLALRYGTGRWTDGASDKLFDEVVCPVGAPALMQRVAAKGGDLSAVSLIHVRAKDNAHWATWADYLQRRGLPNDHSGGQSFDNYVQAVQAAENGLGVMLGWRSITAGLVAQQRLTALPGGEVQFQTAYFVTASTRSASQPATRAFLAWLLAQVGAAPGRGRADKCGA